MVNSWMMTGPPNGVTCLRERQREGGRERERERERVPPFLICFACQLLVMTVSAHMNRQASLAEHDKDIGDEREIATSGGRLYSRILTIYLEE